ncbi:hypothetical protein FACS1894202_12690 [Clostridia bacterium]|nr:hypothetical protein FACS1894202_12690 [Clostridia bacterium]
MTRYAAQEVVFTVSMTHRAKTVYLVLASFSNKKDTCFPSISTIAERSGLSERTVQRAIADLIAIELVVKIARKRKDNGDTSNLYTLKSSVVTPAPCQAVTGEGDSVSLHELDSSSKQTNLTISDRQDSLFEILENCQLGYVDARYGAGSAMMFRHSVTRLWYSASLRIGNAVLPQSVVRDSLRYLNRDVIEAAICKLRHNPKREVRNSSAYAATVLFNAITEADSDYEVSA